MSKGNPQGKPTTFWGNLLLGAGTFNLIEDRCFDPLSLTPLSLVLQFSKYLLMEVGVMNNLFNTWLGSVIVEIIILALALLFSDGFKLVFFMFTVITATLIIGSTYLLLIRKSTDSINN